MSKVEVDRNIATYELSDTLTKQLATSFVNSINITYTNVKNLKIHSILFSLSGVKNYQSDAFEILIDKLLRLKDNLKVSVGITNYSEEMFKKLFPLVKEREVGLYDNRNTFLFFMNKLPLKKGDKILIYEEDKVEKEALLGEIISKGYLAIAAPTLATFNQKLKQKGSYSVAFKNVHHPEGDGDKESLGTEKIKEARLDGKKRINKELVRELPIFIDSTIDTFESMIGLKTEKKESRITTFDLTDETLLASYINFEGRLDGIILIVFPLSFAKRAYEALFFEDTEDEEELKDALKEFANIIAGRAKALLEEKSIHVNISLPQSYMSIKEVLPNIKGKYGAQVKFETDDGDNLYVFLTR